MERDQKPRNKKRFNIFQSLYSGHYVLVDLIRDDLIIGGYETEDHALHVRACEARRRAVPH